MKKVQNRHALKVQLVDDAEKFQNSSAIKVKVEGGGGGTIDVDDELSTTSENPVQNKVITQAVNADHEEIGRIGGELANKQDTLTAGTGISISEENVISATDGGGDSGVETVYYTTQMRNRITYYLWWKDEAHTTPYTIEDLGELCNWWETGAPKRVKMVGNEGTYWDISADEFDKLSPGWSESEHTLGEGYTVGAIHNIEPYLNDMMERIEGAGYYGRVYGFATAGGSTSDQVAWYRRYNREGAFLMSDSIHWSDNNDPVAEHRDGTPGDIVLNRVDNWETGGTVEMWVCVMGSYESGSYAIWTKMCEGSWTF